MVLARPYRLLFQEGRKRAQHPDGSQARQVTDQPGESRQPWWSPNGSTLALSADHGIGAFAVKLLAVDGSGTRLLANHGTTSSRFGARTEIGSRFRHVSTSRTAGSTSWERMAPTRSRSTSPTASTMCIRPGPRTGAVLCSHRAKERKARSVLSIWLDVRRVAFATPPEERVSRGGMARTRRGYRERQERSSWRRSQS